MKETFSKRMKEAMELRGIKQVELCEKTKIGKSAISQYLSGTYEPKQKGVYLIAKALGVSEAWLMGYDVPMERIEEVVPTVTKEESAMLDMFRQLDREDRNTIFEQMEFMLSRTKYKKSVESLNA